MRIRKGIFKNPEEIEKIWHIAAMSFSVKEFIRYFVDRGLLATATKKQKELKANIERIISESLIDEGNGTIRLYQKEAADKILKLLDEQ